MNELLIVLILHDFFIKSAVSYAIWQILTTLVPITLVTIMMYYLIARKQHSAMIATASAFLFAVLLKTFIELFLIRVRPHIVLGFDKASLLTDSSFYSTHTFIAFASLFVIFSFEKRNSIKWCFLILAIVVALSRIVLAAHYVTDVVVAIILAYLGYLVIKHFKE